MGNTKLFFWQWATNDSWCSVLGWSNNTVICSTKVFTHSHCYVRERRRHNNSMKSHHPLKNETMGTLFGFPTQNLGNLEILVSCCLESCHGIGWPFSFDMLLWHYNVAVDFHEVMKAFGKILITELSGTTVAFNSTIVCKIVTFLCDQLMSLMTNSWAPSPQPMVSLSLWSNLMWLVLALAIVHNF